MTMRGRMSAYLVTRPAAIDSLHAVYARAMVDAMIDFGHSPATAAWAGRQIAGSDLTNVVILRKRV